MAIVLEKGPPKMVEGGPLGPHWQNPRINPVFNKNLISVEPLKERMILLAVSA